MHPHQRGRQSEDLAADYLSRRGYEILARNYRVNRKEIDIIARRRQTVAFVEVKARAGEGFGHPAAAITWKKRREIAHVARAWIARTGGRHLHFRFDAIAISWRGRSFTIEHIQNAWLAE